MLTAAEPSSSDFGTLMSQNQLPNETNYFEKAVQCLNAMEMCDAPRRMEEVWKASGGVAGASCCTSQENRTAFRSAFRA